VNAVNDNPGDILVGWDEAVRNHGVVVQQLITLRALNIIEIIFIILSHLKQCKQLTRLTEKIIFT